jgi:hypothetical protein
MDEMKVSLISLSRRTAKQFYDNNCFLSLLKPRIEPDKAGFLFKKYEKKFYLAATCYKISN